MIKNITIFRKIIISVSCSNKYIYIVNLRLCRSILNSSKHHLSNEIFSKQLDGYSDLSKSKVLFRGNTSKITKIINTKIFYSQLNSGVVSVPSLFTPYI